MKTITPVANATELEAAVATDRDLEHKIELAEHKVTLAGEALAKHRYECTMGPDAKFTIAEYAKAAERSWSTIKKAAAGYEFMINRTPDQIESYPTLSDCMDYAQVAAETRAAREAVAKAHKVKPSSVRSNPEHNDAVKAVQVAAKKVADVRGVNVEDVVDEVAEQHARREEAVREAADHRKAAHSTQYHEVQRNMIEIRIRLRRMAEASDGVSFTDTEVEGITDFIVQTKAILDLFEEKVTGKISVTTDWDAAFAAIDLDGVSE